MQCDETLSLSLFFAAVAEASPPVLGVLGGGCSPASEAMAQIMHHWNVSQIAYSSGSSFLSNKYKFKNFFRTHSSDSGFHSALVTLLKSYDWNRIMVITQDKHFFTETYENFHPLLVMHNVTVMNRMVSSSLTDVQHLLNGTDFFFPDDDIRVILMNTNSDVAKLVMCEGLKGHNLLGYPRYVWITYDWYHDGWWHDSELVRCDEDELALLLRRSLVIRTIPVSEAPDAPTDVAMTANQFYDEYQKRLSVSGTQSKTPYTDVATLAYDAVWSLALALNKTDAMLRWPKELVFNETDCEDDGNDLEGVYLSNFTYDHHLIGCIIRWNLARTNFTGVSGRVTFDGNGTRVEDTVTLLQYRDTPSDGKLSRVVFGHINNCSLQYIDSEQNETVFPEGIPSDGTPIHQVITFHLAVVVLCDTLAGLGLIFTTVCLLFNFIFRKKKIVQMTSPNLNYFIIVGSYILYASVFVRLIPSTDETVNYVRCNLRILLNTFPFCLTFGTALAKMSRVYHIFNNPSENRKVALKDVYLALIVIAITVVGGLIPVFGWAIPPLRATPSLQPDDLFKSTVNDQGVTVLYDVWLCNVGNYTNIVNILVFIYLLTLQIISIVLAVQTRNVKIKVLNDYKYVSTLIYITSVVWFLLGILTFFLPWDAVSVTEMIFSVCILIITTAFLSLTFIPKMWSLYTDPQGKNIFQDIETTIAEGKHETLTARNSIPTERGEERIAKELEDRNRELEEINMNLVQRNRELEEQCRTFDAAAQTNVTMEDSHENASSLMHIERRSEEEQCQ